MDYNGPGFYSMYIKFPFLIQNMLNESNAAK